MKPWMGSAQLAWLVVAVLAPAAPAKTPAPASASDGRLAVDATAQLESEVISRDSEGGITIRGTRVAERLRIDGRLDEDVYRTVHPFGDFVQQEPRDGQPSTVETDVWVLFDDEHV